MQELIPEHETSSDVPDAPRSSPTHDTHVQYASRADASQANPRAYRARPTRTRLSTACTVESIQCFREHALTGTWISTDTLGAPQIFASFLRLVRLERLLETASRHPYRM